MDKKLAIPYDVVCAVFNSAIAALTSGGRIFVKKGTYTLTTDIPWAGLL